ncbi:30S ribosomal protein S1 [Kiritimatiella glycovorans]|uniref:30S ribosomal protein S1 n=1 Tax=Kiritimatiella glycovorans TaxID=1307763 RepID=A0A0G3EBU8_9BACT|nr:30S ribosomal protein S1 [Kiritimatiella glycovorans]AKJ63778.1 30S ribosomal protein S1 [Kiritimatiella glycovorans]
MNEEQNTITEEMLQDDTSALEKMYEETLRDFQEGSIVTGKIIDIRPNEVLVDIGYKSEGLVSREEFDSEEEIEADREIEVFLDRLEDEHGMVVLSKHRADLQRNWNKVIATCEEGSTIEGNVKRRVKGGLIVDINGIEAFLPGSQVDVVPVRDLDECIGQTYEFKILKINEERKNIVVSRRELIEESRREARQQLLAEIKPGQIRSGRVKNITDFGAFIDLNGADGLLHVTDMGWGRVNHPSEVVSVGQELEVMVLDVNREKERISLGLKQTQRNPWEDIEERYPVGSRVHGRVMKVAPYGAFVEIEEGVEGLVHVSEMSWTKRVAKAADVVNEGDEVDVVVLSINKDEQKISLGMRQTEANPWEVAAETYPIGSRVKGTVRNFTSYGAFVEVEEGIDGMIHVSDMSWTRKVNHPSEVLEKGEEVECVVLEVDPENQRMSLGLKQAQEDPWAKIAKKFSVGDIVKGTVTKIASFGAFVEIEEGVEGLVHISQISSDHVEKVRDKLDKGQEVEARIVKIDPAERRIGLSIKAAEVADEDFEVNDEMLEGLRPGEDLVDLAGAFDDAISSLEEWHPGDKKSGDSEEPEPSDQSGGDEDRG